MGSSGKWVPPHGLEIDEERAGYRSWRLSSRGAVFLCLDDPAARECLPAPITEPANERSSDGAFDPYFLSRCQTWVAESGRWATAGSAGTVT